jgi:hypothetical protein
MKRNIHVRAYIYGIFLVAVFAGRLWAGEIEVGDSREEVIQEVGEPRGTMLSLRMETLFYERGTVTLRDGTVVHVRLKTAEEVVREKARRRQEEAARKVAQEQERERRIEEGKALKAWAMNDPEFKQSSPAERLDYWRKFQKTYPKISVSEEIASAEREKLEMEREKLAVRIQELKQEIEEITATLKRTTIDYRRRRHFRVRRLLMEELEETERRHRALGRN